MKNPWLVVAIAIGLGGCSTSSLAPSNDAGRAADAPSDARDAGDLGDADHGDAGAPTDAGADSGLDAAGPDAALDDAGQVDAGAEIDAALEDAAFDDAASADAAVDDAAVDDAAVDDAAFDDAAFDDAAFDDAAFDPDVFVNPDAGPLRCGNGRIDPMEECDDRNRVDGDGCDSMCRREVVCGNGRVDAGELCDDGNTRSGDGCRSDCRSDETCGNGLVDQGAGEVCDGGPNCAMDCRSVIGCGNGMMDPGEQCDDGNTTRWDGCSPQCAREIVLDTRTPRVALALEGCDFSGDGRADNQFARALGPAAGLLNMFLPSSLGILLSFHELDDLSGAEDADLRVGYLTGRSATGGYRVDRSALDAQGLPRTMLAGAITMRELEAGPADIAGISIQFITVSLEDARVSGTTVATMGTLSSLSDAYLCGVVPPDTLAAITAPALVSLINGFLGMNVMVGPNCDGSTAPATLLDLAAGGTSLGIFLLPPTPPDVDVDGDGLEAYELTRTGPMGCQPVITACLDGDGTRIEGRNCIDDPRMADGYSAAFGFTGTRVNVIGTR